jgi:hypothetical protein
MRDFSAPRTNYISYNERVTRFRRVAPQSPFLSKTLLVNFVYETTPSAGWTDCSALTVSPVAD